MSSTYRVVLCGETAVGKTALVGRLVGNPFTQTVPTLTSAQTAMELEHRGQLYTVSLQDTAGQERYKAISASFFNNANIVLFVYSVTSEESLQQISTSWLEMAEERAMDAKRIIVGNKIDLANERSVDHRQGYELAEQLGAKFVETSAVTSEGVSDLREIIGELVAQIDSERVKNDVKKPGVSFSEPRGDHTFNNGCQC